MKLQLGKKRKTPQNLKLKNEYIWSENRSVTMKNTPYFYNLEFIWTLAIKYFIYIGKKLHKNATKTYICQIVGG